jgi:hypothetical protein
MRTETRWDEVETPRAHLAELMCELDRMPAFKHGTYFETSRIRQRDILRRVIARLEAEL